MDIWQKRPQSFLNGRTSEVDATARVKVTLAEAELVRDGVLQRETAKASGVFERLLLAATGSRWEPSQRVLQDLVVDFCTYVRCAAAMSSQRLGGSSDAASRLLAGSSAASVASACPAFPEVVAEASVALAVVVEPWLDAAVVADELAGAPDALRLAGPVLRSGVSSVAPPSLVELRVPD